MPEFLYREKDSIQKEGCPSEKGAGGENHILVGTTIG